jgi:uncharacterized membrane protein YhaH (DUF805 family)
MDWKFLFFSADGRISRQQFWIGALILIGAGVVLGWIPIIGWLISLVSLYAWVCLYSKRLHDFGKSGWLTAIPVGLTIVCAIAAIATMGGMAAMGAFNTDYMHPGAMMGMGLTAALMGLAMLVSLGFLLWVGLTPTQPGANKYGEPPSADPVPEAKAGAPQG